jgi:putative transposase
MQITCRYRLKDRHIARLAVQAAAVNDVCNFCNEVQTKTAKEGRKWLDYGDLHDLTAGATKAGLDLHSQTVQQICKQYDVSRRQHKKPWLSWHKTNGARRSLGWVAFNQQALSFRDGAFCGEGYDVWLHRPLPDGAKIGSGSFSEDWRGRWYINVPVLVPEAIQAANTRVEIDLGAIAGDAVQWHQDRHASILPGERDQTRDMQGARKSKRVNAIHAKIRNRRKDFLHKETTKLVQQFASLRSAMSARRNSLVPTWQRASSMPVGRTSGPCCHGQRDCAAAACVLR